MGKRQAFYNLEICWRAMRSRAFNRAQRRILRPDQPIDIFLCVVDHFEPSVGGATREKARERMEHWLRRYPEIAQAHSDFDGRMPAHGFFYPWDEFESEEFCQLSALCRQGFGEIDLHLHHRDDTEETLRKKLSEAIATYHAQRVFPTWQDGSPAFAFIHGNWALDNSRQDGGRNYCGVNNEIKILAELGCYADLTFPAWQHAAQPRQTNSLYYATDTPEPKSYEYGAAAQAGKEGKGDLLLLQGALVPYLARRGKGVRLAVDDGDLAHSRRYAPERLDRWVESGIHVLGRPDRIFIKLHSHGAADENRTPLLEHDLHALFTDAEARYNDGKRYRLRYVTAREMYNVVKATEAEANVPIATMRDWILKPPRYA